MKPSCRAIYGLRAVFDLAYHGGAKPMQVRDIAERTQVPARFLEQIFQDLKRAELVESKRGPKGGYLLVVAPEDITLARIFEALEDLPQMPDVNDECAQRSLDATHVSDEACREIVERTSQMLEAVTVADLMHRGEAQGIQRMCYEGFVYVI
ncbi:MAG: Rrf2 family transcriptional regulator [Bradymonadaceae bacterium]|nr:Rrf2 family transcriptional regulator [Lujinxingiaceae bacterium]